MVFASILAAALIVDYVELEHIHNQSTSNDSCTIAAWGSKLFTEQATVYGSTHEGPWCGFLTPIRDEFPTWMVYNPTAYDYSFSYQTLFQDHHMSIAEYPYHTSDPVWERGSILQIYNGLPGRD